MMKTLFCLFLVITLAFAFPGYNQKGHHHGNYVSSESDSSSSSESHEDRKYGVHNIRLRSFVDRLPPELQASVKQIEQQMPVERLPAGSLTTGDVRFYLYTQLKPYPTEIVAGNTHLIDTSKPIKYIIHGWLQNSETQWVINMKDQYLSKKDYNVIIVDWKRPAWQVYGLSVSYTPKVADLISTHIVNAQLPVSNIHIVGFSMGAQVAGYLGKKIIDIKVGEKLARITALDPSGPGYQESSYQPKDKLTKDDAAFVDVTHTDKTTFGYSNPFGSVDFFPNGGARDAPGCMGSTTEEDGVNCSHARSVLYFIESINSQRFLGIECGSWAEYDENKCANNKKVMYGERTPTNTKGKFYYKTNSQAPFAQG